MLNLDNFHQQVADFIYYLDDNTANKFFKSLKKEDLDLINSNESAQTDFLEMKFLLIPFLSDNELSTLFKRNIKLGLSIDDIDIPERIKKRLIFSSIEYRDEIKKSLKSDLLSNQEIITKKALGEKNLTRISDWLKDYIIFSNDEKNALKKAQYFNKFLVSLSDGEKIILKKLFDIYNFLDVSSKSPEGFEDDLLLKDELGRIVTTHNGSVVVLYDPKNINKLNKKQADDGGKNGIENNDVLADKKLPNIESLDALEASAAPKKSIISETPTPPQKINIPRTTELEEILASYSASSLEYKAISQEIMRLKKTEARKNAKR